MVTFVDASLFVRAWAGLVASQPSSAALPVRLSCNKRRPVNPSNLLREIDSKNIEESDDNYYNCKHNLHSLTYGSITIGRPIFSAIQFPKQTGQTGMRFVPSTVTTGVLHSSQEGVHKNSCPFLHLYLLGNWYDIKLGCHFDLGRLMPMAASITCA